MTANSLPFPTPERPLGLALRRGFRQVCPACGAGRLYAGFLKTVANCPACGEAMHHHRADDAPPYFTIFIVGHVVVPLLLLLEKWMAPAEWVQLSIWLPMTVLLSLWVLPRVKGALVGLQWAKRMHGFGGGD